MNQGIVIRLLSHDLLCDFGLAAHRIDRHQSPGNLEQFQQLRNGRPLS